MLVRVLLFFCFLCTLGFAARAQSVKGEVLDITTKKPIEGVYIKNIYSDLEITTSDEGSFIILATSGELIEFRKDGYKTVRVRIPRGLIPPYFRITMQPGITDIEPVNVAQTSRYDYKWDSLRYHELYKHELDFPRMSTIDMIASPFSALSKKNREIWQFQDDYDEFEKEKYVDHTFNENVVTRFTGLTGDSLHYFMRRYRPTYEQLRSMNDYTFFNFVKTSVAHYRSSANTPRFSQ